MSLSELTEVVSVVSLGCSQLVVLGDSTVHNEAPGVGAALDFMAALVMSQLKTHKLLDLICTARQVGGDLVVEKAKIAVMVRSLPGVI